MAINITDASYLNKHVEITQCSMASPFLEQRPSIKDFLADVRGIVSEINIYENIFSPTLTGDVILQDDVGLSSVIPMIGAEQLTLKFNITDPNGTMRYYGNSSPLSFSVYQETNRLVKNQGTHTYRLGIASPELFLLSEKKISLPYKNVKVETVIQDLVTNPKYGDSKKSLVFEKTKTPINMIVPYLTPLEAIKLLTLQGQNEASESNYTFYETLKGFNFSSIQSMLKIGNALPDSKIPRITIFLPDMYPSKNDIRNIRADSIDIISGFDYLYQLTHGGFASVTIGVDVLSGKYRQTISTSDDTNFKNRMKTNGVGAIPIYPPALGQVANPTGKIFLVPTLSISAANKDLCNKDTSIKDNFIEQTLDGRNRELVSLQSRCVRVKVSGVPELNAGTMVDIDFPIPVNNNKFAPQAQDVASGRYLIVAAKHTLINTGSGQFAYETTFEACSDSYGK